MRTHCALPILLASVLTVLAVAPAASAATKTVYAGAPFVGQPSGAPDAFDLNGFYRRRVSVNVGDTVAWQFRGFHTITFAGAEDAPPFIVPDPANPYAGVNDAAAAPFWFNGQPSLTINPRVAAPSGERATSGQAFRNSGLPLGDRPRAYRLKFTRAGKFSYLCVVHPGMRASVKVVNRRRATPSARADARAARREAAVDIRRGRRLSGYRPSGNRVVAGHDRGPSTFFRFFPTTKRVKVGQAVQFAIDSRTEIHNVAFGPRAYRTRLARDMIMPRPAQGGPPVLQLSPLVFLPSDPPPTVPPFTGANHGNGFLNTGILDRDPASPTPPSATVTFTRAGRFEYECLIHPGMRGSIRVE